MTSGCAEMVIQVSQRKYSPPSLCSAKHTSSVVWELTALEQLLSLVKHPSPAVKISLSETDSHDQSGPAALTASF